MNNPARDDFPNSVKTVLAARAGYRCSKPDCRAQTSGPRLDENKSITVGVGAHITAASPGGPRYDPTLTAEQRMHIDNGIWLCSNHGKIIDNDVKRYPVDLLHKWKKDAEALATVRTNGFSLLEIRGSK